MQLTKANLYNEIQKYIYDDAFSDLNVFSKQYFHSILSQCCSDNSKCDEYSIISIDFNNMQQINKNGIERGDQILHDSIELMQSVLPENSYTLRLGGDEFLFILNNESKENSIQYEEKMHQMLKDNSKKIDGTTVTSYCVSSKEAQSIQSLIDIADVAITAIKQGAKIPKSLDNWNILEKKAEENFSTFFKTLRFHNYPMGIEELEKILLEVSSTYDDYVEQKDNFENIAQNEENLKNKKIFYDIESLKSLNELFTRNGNKKVDYSQLDKYDESTLAIVLDSLVRDSISNQFTESYFKKFLLDESNEKFKVLKISPAFVKFSNTINSSHSATNVQMENYQKDFYQFLNDRIDFNQDTYTHIPSNYLVALSGGDMLLAANKKTKISVKEINDFLNQKNSVKYSTDNILRYVVADEFKIVNKNNFKKVLSKQTDECNKNKIPLIKEILNDEIIKKLLEVTLKDTMEFYSELVPDIKNISAKTTYVDLVSKTISNLYNTLDVVHETDNINNKSGKNKENRILNYLKKFSSIFRKKHLALPEPKENIEKDQSSFNNSSHENQSEERLNFISSIKVDDSKNNSEMNQDQASENIKDKSKLWVKNQNNDDFER